MDSENVRFPYDAACDGSGKETVSHGPLPRPQARPPWPCRQQTGGKMGARVFTERRTGNEPENREPQPRRPTTGGQCQVGTWNPELQLWNLAQPTPRPTPC